MCIILSFKHLKIKYKYYIYENVPDLGVPLVRGGGGVGGEGSFGLHRQLPKVPALSADGR